MSRGPATVGRLRAALRTALKHAGDDAKPASAIQAGLHPVYGSALPTTASSEQVGNASDCQSHQNAPRFQCCICSCCRDTLPPTVIHMRCCKSDTQWQHSEGSATLQKCRLSEFLGGHALQAAHESLSHGWSQQAVKMLFGLAAASIACGAVAEAAEERLNPGIHPLVPLAACWTGTC